MPSITTKEITLEYQVSGQSNSQPLLIVAGLGVQMNQGMEDLIPALVSQGFKVITYDNRDVGLSTKHDNWGPADIKTAMTQVRANETVSAPYTLEDMAADGIGLLDGLGIAKAHVMGSSNGGAIAQLMALNYPDRVATLTCVMATSGRRGLPRASEAANKWLTTPRNPEGTREGAAKEAITKAQIIGSACYPRTETDIRNEALHYYDRSFSPQGNGRQLLASIASADKRVPRLCNITAPTLVLHGLDDPLVPYQCGEDIQATIPNAQIELYAGMAHEFSAELVPQIAQRIANHGGQNQV